MNWKSCWGNNIVQRCLSCSAKSSWACSERRGRETVLQTEKPQTSMLVTPCARGFCSVAHADLWLDKKYNLMQQQGSRRHQGHKKSDCPPGTPANGRSGSAEQRRRGSFPSRAPVPSEATWERGGYPQRWELIPPGGAWAEMWNMSHGISAGPHWMALHIGIANEMEIPPPPQVSTWFHATHWSL